MSQLTNTDSTCAAQWKMWLIKLISVTLVASVASDPFPTSPTTSTDYALPIPSVLLKSGWSDVFPSEKVELSCNIDNSSDWIFIWFQNTEKVPDHDPNFHFNDEGLILTFTAATETHSGNYSCQGKHKTKGLFTEESDDIAVDVYPKKPKPIVTQTPNFGKLFRGESVSLSCLVDESDGWRYVWYSDDKEIQETNEYIVSSADQPRSVKYSCKARREQFFSEQSDGTVLEFSDPPQPSLKPLTPWLDVFQSEKVELSCEVNGPDWRFTWHKNGEMLNAGLSIALSQEGSLLTIPSVDQTNQGLYECKAHHKSRQIISAFSNPANVTVYAVQPKPLLNKDPGFTQMYVGETVQMTCTVDVSFGWEYLWYQNGHKLIETNENVSISLSRSDGGKYSCRAIRGNNTLTEYSNEVTQDVLALPIPSVLLKSGWSDVFPSEKVELSCNIDNSSDWIFIWFQNTEKVPDHDPNFHFNDEGLILTFTAATETHSGNYSCQGKHKTKGLFTEESDDIAVDVYPKKPKPIVTQTPNFGKLFRGESVSLSCLVDESDGWRYVWYSDDKEIQETNEYIVSSADQPRSVKYSCKARREQFFSEQSDGTVLEFSEIPVPSLNLRSSWFDVFPTESVELSCGIQSVFEWTYTWYKEGHEVQHDNTLSFGPDGKSLSINSASHLNAGQYKCVGQLVGRSVSSNVSSGLSLKVYDKKPSITLTQDPEYKLMYRGESVAFRCHVNVSSGWEYQWFKDGEQLDVRKDSVLISSAVKTNSGSYTCQAKRGQNKVFLTALSQAAHLTIKAQKPKPLLTQEPNADKVYTGEPVSFKCAAGISSDWEYQWFKDKVALSTTGSTLSIYAADFSSSGAYECMATRRKTLFNTDRSEKRTLSISEIPVPVLKLRTPWSDVFPTESVEMSCEMESSSEWTYTWYKDGEKVQSDSTLSFGLDAATFSINSASPAHGGQYSCKAHHKSRSVNSNFSPGLPLKVYEMKPSIILTQNPYHEVMYTEETVTFSCQANASHGWKYELYKDGKQLPMSGNNHKISVAVESHSGSYKCRAQRYGNKMFHTAYSQDMKLHIQTRPQTGIVLLTGWSEVFSTDSLVLRCEMQETQDLWNYTWFKEGEVIALPPSDKHIVTPQNDPEQSQYTCQGNRTARPSYSRQSEPFKTKNLLVKRRVLLSISGCLFFGIIAVFLGCIALRVFRKPAENAENLDEPNLFLTMAELKARDDAPCPLVEYITDASLNTPPKDEDDNCSELSPLCVTSEEDQAVTSESNGTAENNGGLVSFKS